MTYEQLIAASFDARTARLKLQKEVDLLEQKEKDANYEIIKHILENGAMTETEGPYHVSMKSTMEPVLTDWELTRQYILATGSIDLLQKRLTPSAVKARWDGNVIVPGVEPQPTYKLTITKD